jgi:hypothetical protein
MNALGRIVSVAAAFLLFPSLIIGQAKTQPDVWEPLKFLAGTWEGTGKGQPGASRVEREYRFVFNGKFLGVRNRSVYDPQPKSPKGEIHEDWGMIGFDKFRKQFVFRQFHVESFVIHYVMTSAADKTIVFTSESIENVPSGWRARETYKIVGPDEFIEVFELAQAGKEFQVYSEGHLRRKK